MSLPPKKPESAEEFFRTLRLIKVDPVVPHGLEPWTP